jgi:fructokinase
MSKPGPLIAGIEAGGTKFVLAVGPSPTHITARHTIATTTPEETLAQAAQWFRDQGTITSLGIASFGPVDLDQASPTWGHITNTPKPRWSGCNIAGYFADRMQVPLGFDTDVNAAALAEYLYGAGKGSRSIAYITIGTGIGGGLIIDGKPVHGIAHPEMGHIVPRRHGGDREFAGICPHHSDCLEGLASGPAIKARWGSSLSDLPQDHAAHAIVAEYIAQLCHALFAIAAVETIVLGGGVMKTAGLLQRVKDRAASLDGGYLPGKARHCIVAPALGDNSGITGALSLAQ